VLQKSPEPVDRDAYNDGGACFEISLRDYNLERD